MRLPLLVGNAIRERKLIPPSGRVLVALSGGPDSVALLLCMLELSKKRDLKFALAAAHLNHSIRGKDADRDESFCRKLCKKKGVEFIAARADAPSLSGALNRSLEESARIVRRAFLAAAALRTEANCVAVAHHADDRIETVLYRICRGTGMAGLRGIGWTGPLKLDDEPNVDEWIQWLDASGKPQPTAHAAEISFAAGNDEAHRKQLAEIQIVRPMLGCTRPEVLEYLKQKRQNYCTDLTNFDNDIPRNAIRNQVLPILAGKVHAGARQALWRLAEEADIHAAKRAWRREWLGSFADAARHGTIELPVPSMGSPPELDELADTLDVLKTLWKLKESQFTHRHAQALRRLFNPGSGPKSIDLPNNLVAEREGKKVTIRKNYRARELL
ncbi:MAG TPA: tRNA lysidine(34) synthetase TilS [Planctomycetota bacterium]|nr:tRNA lysidine(34) synthetase TilS [Planctomycetota bacterium]